MNSSLWIIYAASLYSNYVLYCLIAQLHHFATKFVLNEYANLMVFINICVIF